MKKLTLALVLVCSVLLFSACENSGWLADKSQPWKDDIGNWHTRPVCGNHPTTNYITIMDDSDSASENSYNKSYSSSNWYSQKKYKNQGYSYSKRKNHTMLTMPVQTDEWSCTYI